MPIKSEKQRRLMQAAAHTPGGFGGVPQSVGKKFMSSDHDRSGAGYNERRNSDYKRGRRSSSARDHKEFETANDKWRAEQAKRKSNSIRDDIEKAIHESFPLVTGAIGGTVGGRMARRWFNKQLRKSGSIKGTILEKKFKKADKLFRRGVTLAGATAGGIPAYGAGSFAKSVYEYKPKGDRR